MNRTEALEALRKLRDEVDRIINEMSSGTTAAPAPSAPQQQPEAAVEVLPKPGRRLRARKVTSTKPGVCCVCRQPYPANHPILFADERGVAAHVECGSPP